MSNKYDVELDNMNVVIDFEVGSSQTLDIGFTTRTDGMHTTKISLWNITSNDIDELISTLKQVKKDIKKLEK